MQELFYSFIAIMPNLIIINPNAFGIVAVGNNAFGIISIGINAVGVVAIGGVNAIGIFLFAGINTLGGFSISGVNCFAVTGRCFRKNGFKRLKIPFVKNFYADR